MFKIYDGREHFYQWDLDRKLIVEDPDVKEVHFTNRATNDAYVCETYAEDGKTLVNVPNILLQTNWRIQVYAYDGKHTKHDKCYEVRGRSKPVDYVYTETEVYDYRAVREEVDALSGNVESFGKQIYDLETDVSALEEDNNFMNETLNILSEEVYSIWNNCGISYTHSTLTSFNFRFAVWKNVEAHFVNAMESISFDFEDGEYAPGYTSGIVFDSGEIPTRIDYTGSGILNWVGTDCSVSGGYSIFKPAANKHYEIVFYFNGAQFIGLVNGFVPAIGNVVE
jgi:hypothetical protein